MDREKRIQFIKDRGYKNVSVFAEAVNEHPSNVHKILKGQQIPKIQKLFVYAAALDVDISKVLEMFYPEEMMQYKEARKQRRTHGDNH